MCYMQKERANNRIRSSRTCHYLFQRNWSISTHNGHKMSNSVLVKCTLIVASVHIRCFRSKKKYLPLYPTRREMGDLRWVIAYNPNMHIDNPTVSMYGAPSTPNCYQQHKQKKKIANSVLDTKNCKTQEKQTMKEAYQRVHTSRHGFDSHQDRAAGLYNGSPHKVLH